MSADFADIAVYDELRDRGELTARIYVRRRSSISRP
jgi:hypothetical protein